MILSRYGYPELDVVIHENSNFSTTVYREGHIDYAFHVRMVVITPEKVDYLHWEGSVDYVLHEQVVMITPEYLDYIYSEFIPLDQWITANQ